MFTEISSPPAVVQLCTIRNKKKLPKLLAEAKALSISKKNTQHLVVGSDTIILFNNKIIINAKTIEEA